MVLSFGVFFLKYYSMLLRFEQIINIMNDVTFKLLNETLYLLPKIE